MFLILSGEFIFVSFQENWYIITFEINTVQGV